MLSLVIALITFVVSSSAIFFVNKNKSWWKFKKDKHYDEVLKYWKNNQKYDNICIKMTYEEFYKFYSLTPDAFTFKVEYVSWGSYRFIIQYEIYDISEYKGNFLIVPNTDYDFNKIFYIFYESDLNTKKSNSSFFTRAFLEDYRKRLKNEMDLADQKIEEAKKNILDIQNRL